MESWGNMQIICVVTGIKYRGQHSSDTQHTLHLRFQKLGGGGGVQKSPLLIYKNSLIIQIWHALSALFENYTLTFQRCREYIVPKFSGGGKITPVLLYKKNAHYTNILAGPYQLFHKKNYNTATFFQRCHLCLRFLKFEKGEGGVKITPVLIYKKLLTLQMLQAISAASLKHSRGAQGT